MFRQIAAALVLVLISAGTAAADGAAPPPSSLDALKSDPHVIKAMEFMAASGSRDAMLQRMDLIVDLLIEQERKTKTNVSDKMWDVLRSAVKDELRAGADDLLLMSAKIYADHFSDAEMDALIAFYKSDVGVKYLRERPAIVQEEVAVGKAWGERMAPLVRDHILQKLQAMGANQEQKT